MRKTVSWDMLVQYFVVPDDEESPKMYQLVDIPEAQMEWINEVMQDYIHVQEYLSAIYEQKRRSS